MIGVWWLNGNAPDCHSAVPGLNPASLNLQEHVSSLLGSQQGWHCNCRLASEGQQRQKSKIKQNNKEEKNVMLHRPLIPILCMHPYILQDSPFNPS